MLEAGVKDATAGGAAIAQDGPAFLRALAAVNLQRLFPLLIIGWVSRAMELAFNQGSAITSELLGFLQLFDLFVIPPLTVFTWWARRRCASLVVQWSLILFITIGTLGMMIVYALATVPEIGYRATYVFGVMVCAVVYIVPPRVMMPLFAVMHLAYCALVLTGGYDERFRLASMTDGTLGVCCAAGASWLLYRAKWNDFLKEQTIAAQNRALTQRNAEMTDLMSLAAHDLRSPLQGLEGVLALAGTMVDPAAVRLRRALGEGRESCHRMLSLVTRLLDAHAAEHRRKTGGVARCDARLVFADTVQRHETAAQARSVRLLGEGPAGCADVGMEAEALGQVLDNLVGNALKFAPADTAIDIVLRASDSGWIGEVRDEGPGVPADEQVELFGKFRRGARAPANGEGGFGLGLFIARQLVVSAGGQVTYADRAPHGAIFRVELPRVAG
jgi:nitrogen-specific signal transduction histidine kinase